MKSTLSIILIFSVIFNLQAQQKVVDTFFKNTDAFLKANVINDGVNYAAVKNNPSLNALVKTIAEVDLSKVDAVNAEAFYINAYNILVINAAAKNYPLTSVQSINGFFDSKKYTVAGQQMTLNNLEKEKLLKVYKDPRFHFVLVCGALGCPPITNFAYVPNKLEEQLETQTRKALNDKAFIQITNGEEVQLSQIFEWYADDFGGSKKSAIEYINGYRENKIPAQAKVGFYPYDWALNDSKVETTNSDTGFDDGAANSARYVVSSAIPKGKIEVKIFNNLYTQRTGSPDALTTRNDFFSTNGSFLYGFTNRFNAGFDFRYRRVANSNLPSSPLGVLGNNADISSRTGFTNFGPKIRVAPFPALENFSFQSAYWFPLGDDLEGDNTAEKPYIDWNGGTFVTQLFNDFSIGESFSLFTEIDLWAEDIGKSVEGGESYVNRISTPVSVIFSYFPNQKTTLYALSNFSPYYNQESDKYFYQFGLGAKYQFTPDFEIELLLTDFNGQNLNKNGGQATTFNVGFRYSN